MLLSLLHSGTVGQTIGLCRLSSGRGRQTTKGDGLSHLLYRLPLPMPSTSMAGNGLPFESNCPARSLARLNLTDTLSSRTVPPRGIKVIHLKLDHPDAFRMI